jgi:hypothetical protein
MNRKEIFEEIIGERDYQDANYPRDERRKTMYQFSAPHLLLLEQKITTMRGDWYKSDVKKSDLIKIAAIAIRALEEISEGELQ